MGEQATIATSHREEERSFTQNEAALSGDQSMDVELSSHSPQAQHAGRGDRVARTREAIVASTLTLAMEGEVAPIVRDIAKLAGVSARTVFQHFADTAELYVAVLGRVLANLANDPPVNGAGPVADKSGLDERISTAIGQRAGRYEKLVPMWTFVETLQRRSTEAGEKVNQLYTSNREQLAEAFGAELTSMPGENRERTLNALAMALTPEGWIVLRERLGLTVEQAREEWRFIVSAVFKDSSR
jgi:AcrR family transcriptional regulator